MSKVSKARRSSCGRKTRHATEQDAINHRHQLRRKYGSTAEVYKCICGFFHVGHRPRR